MVRVGPSLLGGGDLLLQCPVRSRDSYPRASEGQGQLNTDLIFNTRCSYGPCGNTDHGHHHRPQLQQELGPLAAAQAQTSPWFRGRANFPDRHGPGGVMALGQEHGQRCDQIWHPCGLW